MNRGVWPVLVPTCLVLSCLLSAVGCGKGRPELNVYTWADYINPEIVARFESEHGCRVVIDTFDSNESMYAKLKAGAAGYDVITPSSYMVSLMHAQGMLQAFDHGRLPNLAHVDRDYLAKAIDKTMDHSAPYMVVNTVIGYLESRVPDFVPSTSMFERGDLKGRMTLLNDMRETIGAGLKSLGYSINTRDERELREARDIVIRWKRNIAKFENEQYKTGLASGEFLLVQGYSGDILQIQKENPDVRLAVPREGTVISVDDLAFPRTARQTALAHAFINYLHEPAVAAANSNFIKYLCPNTGSYPLLGPDLKDNPAVFLSPELAAKSEILADLGAANALYVKIWDEIKAAK